MRPPPLPQLSSESLGLISLGLILKQAFLKLS